jgi:hypothetical protein
MALCVTLLIVTLLLGVPAAMLDHYGTRLVHRYGPPAPVPVHTRCVNHSGEPPGCPGG